MNLKEVAEWFDIADKELITANNNYYKLYPPNFEVIYTLCARSIEKHLKGYLTYNNATNYPHGHDLNSINNMCRGIDNSFDDFKTNFKTITSISNHISYPVRRQIHNDDVKYALYVADEVRNFKAIQEIKDIIICQYGKNWQNDLFYDSDDDD